MINSISVYILFIASCLYLLKVGDIEKYKLYLLLGLNIIIIKDILLFLYEKKEIKKTKSNIKKLFKDYESNSITFKYIIIFLNRTYFFPFILVIYMLYLLLDQTGIFSINKIKLFIIINQNYILFLTILSGIFTVFKENKDKNYQIEVQNRPILSIFLTIILSLSGTYIIFIQTFKLGFLSYPISLVSGLLIFFVGISILEDDDDENIEPNLIS